MRKKLKLILVGCLILVISIYPLLYNFGSPRMQGHLYWGDHIKINLDITDNGREVSTSNIAATCSHDSEDVRISSKENRFSVRGNEYGYYYFLLKLPLDEIDYLQDDLTVEYTFWKINWTIVDIECSIDMNSDESGCSGVASVTYTYNDGIVETNTFDFTLDDKNTISFYKGL